VSFWRGREATEMLAPCSRAQKSRADIFHGLNP